MSRTGTSPSLLCARCLRAHLNHGRAPRYTAAQARALSSTTRSPLTAGLRLHEEKATEETSQAVNDVESNGTPGSSPESRRAMTQRLQDLSEADLTGTRKEDVEAAGFSEELKEQLLKRLSQANSARQTNQQAFSVAELRSSAGQGTRDIAGAQPWADAEPLGDAALRMLTDVHKPLRTPARVPSPARPPRRVDTGRPGASGGGKATGTRLANARDRSSTYAYLKDPALSAEERDKMRAQLKERFKAGARPMPTSVQGLASLANERIEDAIARGQFRNLPRGMKIERDYNASNPFIDTTEYLMNKMIQKQEIVPPWIEKQQELVAAAARFRATLRRDWRRHAARLIASRGGPLDAQIARAQAYARAELAANPPARREESVTAVAQDGALAQLYVVDELRAPPDGSSPRVATTVTLEPAEGAAASTPSPNDDAPASTSTPAPDDTPPREPLPSTPATGPVFRDPAWESTERSYLTAAIAALNSQARSYNLQAPDAAKKPYFSLERELRACYADAAPLVAEEIRERALGPRARADGPAGPRGRGLVDHLLGEGGHVARVRDENAEKQYGFRQFWRDVFGADGKARGA